MDEGIVEGCEDAGDAKDEFTCIEGQFDFLLVHLSPRQTHPLGPEDQARCSRWQRVRPSSWEAL